MHCERDFHFTPHLKSKYANAVITAISPPCITPRRYTRFTNK
jgi:hypothetical protein